MFCSIHAFSAFLLPSQWCQTPSNSFLGFTLFFQLYQQHSQCSCILFPYISLDVTFIYLASVQLHLQKNNLIKKTSFRLLKIHWISALLIQRRYCVPLILPTNWNPFTDQESTFHPPTISCSSQTTFPTASQKLILLPESPRSSFHMVPFCFYSPELGYLTLFHLIPTCLLTWIFRALFFPQFCCFFSSSALPLPVLCLEHLIHQLSHLPVFKMDCILFCIFLLALHQNNLGASSPQKAQLATEVEASQWSLLLRLLAGPLVQGHLLETSHWLHGRWTRVWFWGSLTAGVTSSLRAVLSMHPC